jgi:hypothetical protein
MMACIAYQGEDVPGAICSVVGAAESHLAIVLRVGFLLSTNLNARSRYAEKPRRTISGQEPRACEILCAHWMAEIQGTADRVQRQTL